MSVTVYFANVSKRRNSTYQGTFTTSYDCVLKDATSLDRPTFLVSAATMDYNAAKWGNRYYFIDDVVSVRNNQWEVSCVLDVLATYKSSIISTSQFVERANVLLDPVKMDGLNPPTCRTLIKNKQLATLANDVIQYSGGNVVSTYILGVASKNGVDYIECDSAKLTSILGIAFGQNITSQFYNMSNCIVSLMRVPYDPPTTTGVLCIGDVTTPDSAKIITNDYITQTVSETLLDFPSFDHLNYGSYVDYPPFTSGVIHLPFVGLVPLDMSIVGTTRKIGVELKLDPKTADIVYIVHTTGNRILGTYAGNCGSQLPIVGQTRNALAMPAALLTAASGVMTDNPMLAASGVLSAVMTQQRQTQINGSLSSFIAAKLDPTIWCEVYTKEPTSWTLDNMKSTQGVVVMEQTSLSGLSGFVQCRNAHVACAAQARELDAIDTYLNGGFYIE